MAKTTVWVLLYHHRHGTDVSVYRSEDSAYKASAQICVENMDEGELDRYESADEIKQRIRTAWKSGKWVEVTEAWRDVYEDEYFEIEERELHD